MNSGRVVIQMTNSMDQAVLGRRLRIAREARVISQTMAGDALGLSQPTYARIELGKRALAGDELVVLADMFGVRAASITGLAQVSERAIYAARTDGNNSPMAEMRERLYTCLELDAYLSDQGVAGA